MNEDIRQRLINFTVTVLKLADTHSGNRTLTPVFHQIVRSAGSIGANVTEAQGSASKKEFINFFHIALKSAKETKYWLLVLESYNESIKDEVVPLMNETTAFIKILTSSILTMKNKK